MEVKTRYEHIGLNNAHSPVIIGSKMKVVESSLFYSIIIDPVLIRMRKRIASVIPHGQKILDVY